MSSVGAVIAAIAGRRSVDMSSDTAMPAVAGSETRTQARARLTSAGAQVTTDALLQGAFDFILRPSGRNPAANKA